MGLEAPAEGAGGRPGAAPRWAPSDFAWGGGGEEAPEVPCFADEYSGYVDPDGGRASGGDAVAAFIAQWDLDHRSEDMLRGLPEDLLQRVLSSFEPDRNTRNRNARLASWVKILQGESGPDRKRPRLSD